MDTRNADRHSRTRKHFKGKQHGRTKKDQAKIINNMYSKSREKKQVRNDPTFNRSQLRHIASETIDILTKGSFTLGSKKNKKIIDLTSALQNSISRTVTYRPKQFPSPQLINRFETVFVIKNLTTLESCKKELNACALNFASAKNPGGKFLNGAGAQEELNTVASGLYVCIKDNPMYSINSNDNNSCLYSDCMIYSPNVPVFRDSKCRLITPYYASFITSPAPNTKEALKRNVSLEDIEEVVFTRMSKILDVAAYNGEETLVLGAWGCGVFGGSISTLIKIYKELFTSKYLGVFKKVIFSILSDDDIDMFKFHFKSLLSEESDTESDDSSEESESDTDSNDSNDSSEESEYDDSSEESESNDSSEKSDSKSESG